MSTNTLFVQRHAAIRKLAEANGWTAHLNRLGDAQRIIAKRGEAETSIWLSKTGAVLDVYLTIPVTVDPVRFRVEQGRGRAYAEQALTRRA